MGNMEQVCEFGGKCFITRDIARKEIRIAMNGKPVYYVWLKNGLQIAYRQQVKKVCECIENNTDLKELKRA